MSRQVGIQTQQTPTTSPLSQSGILQRQCQSCGQHTIAGGECEKCKKQGLTLQRLAASYTKSAEVERSQTFSNSSKLSGQDFSRIPVLTSKSHIIQPQLTISSPEDRYEREANLVAEAVTRTPKSSLRRETETDLPRKILPIQRLGSAVPQTLHRLSISALNDEDQENLVQRQENSAHLPKSESGLTDYLHALDGSGQPLPTSVRNFFEPRFGYNFNQVQIHTDAHANKIAHQLNAQAFTTRQHIVFGTGQYAPETTAGQKLLAHELTHIVQQENALPITATTESNNQDTSQSATPTERVRGSVAPSSLIQRAFFQIPGIVDISPPIQAVVKITSALAASCSPSRKLTWADFTAQPPQSTFSAETHFHHDLVNVQAQQVTQAIFEPSNSWVKPQFSDPTNRAVSTCGTKISRCEQFFDQEAASGRTGGFWRLSSSPSAACPASITSNPSVQATSRAECTSLIGTECDRIAKLESVRLLQHEQTHFDIACVLARKGTNAILGGAKAQTILTAVRTKSAQQTTQYDHQTNHGCNAAAQARWETAVQNELPAVTIP
ncbi:DUF4157 domain-containing protein [Calothrix sp. PCC 7507]|uniref:eCIS core domain-containing protein n=1 Tax=Calothrix sp. PCC 7507 TaxID=99598 RepID=UPI00029F3EF6|nr:DUF4157 domain-containing protein [Calothrix sp. PCC 7507]AFY34119.1 hypothetical protein Cal7507_3728 [Calothrix sp. PCC 7507]